MDFILYNINRTIALNELLKIDDLFAKVENSGSEGYYVEVARFNEVKGTYQRYAFCKLYNVDSAIRTVSRINKFPYIPLIHNMEDYNDR